MSDVRTELSSYRTVLDERAPEVTLTEATTPSATPTPPGRSPWPVLAGSLAVVLVVALVILLNQGGGSAPVDTPVPTTVVDAAPTTVPTPTTSAATPTTAPTETLTPQTDQATGPDDQILLTMAQNLPLNTGPESIIDFGGGEGIEGRSHIVRVFDNPAETWQVDFEAFATSEHASARVAEGMLFQIDASWVREEFTLANLGDQHFASYGETVGFRGLPSGPWTEIAIRHGRFVTHIIVPAPDGSSPAEAIAQATAIAVAANDAMQSTLTSDDAP